MYSQLLEEPGQLLVLKLRLSQFGKFGILLTGMGGDTIRGNSVGTDATGTMAFGNGGGVEVSGTSANTIGGVAPKAGNLISGNGGDGILITSSERIPAGQNVVEGNYVGTDVSGTKALGNATNGVEIGIGESGNTIGVS